MPLIYCPDCGKQISDQAQFCINCGRPMVVPIHRVPPVPKIDLIELPKKYTQRLVFGIITVVLGSMIFFMCISEDVSENSFLAASAANLLIPGLIVLIGRKSKPATITAAGFYFYSFLISFILSIQHSQTIILAMVALGFGIPLLVSGLNQKIGPTGEEN